MHSQAGGLEEEANNCQSPAEHLSTTNQVLLVEDQSTRSARNRAAQVASVPIVWGSVNFQVLLDSGFSEAACKRWLIYGDRCEILFLRSQNNQCIPPVVCHTPAEITISL